MNNIQYLPYCDRDAYTQEIIEDCNYKAEDEQGRLGFYVHINSLKDAIDYILTVKEYNGILKIWKHGVDK